MKSRVTSLGEKGGNRPPRPNRIKVGINLFGSSIGPYTEYNRRTVAERFDDPQSNSSICVAASLVTA
jgi:hypothetical protein